jgi:hypothetical protein
MELIKFMTLQINSLPSDSLWHIFSHTSYKDWPQYQRVCKQWDDVFNQRIWPSISQENFAIRFQQLNNDPILMRKAILNFLITNQKTADFIIEQVNSEDNQELAQHLVDNHELNVLKTGSLMHRSQLIWNKIFTDATPILVKFITDSRDQFIAYKDNHSSKDMNVLIKYCEKDKFSPIIESLIKKCNVPYNKADFICAVMPSLYINSIVKPLILQIVYSHEDLSALKGRTWVRPGVNQQVPIVPSLRKICLHAANNQTMVDALTACKLD